MKTNHRRGFKAVLDRPDAIGYVNARLPDGLGSVGTSFGGDATNGHRGEARQKRGAKKFLRNKIRKTKTIHIEQSLEEG